MRQNTRGQVIGLNFRFLEDIGAGGFENKDNNINSFALIAALHAEVSQMRAAPFKLYSFGQGLNGGASRSSPIATRPLVMPDIRAIGG